MVRTSRTIQGGDNMKLVIEVPETTSAVSVTYIYVENDTIKMNAKMLDTQDIHEQREVTG